MMYRSVATALPLRKNELNIAQGIIYEYIAMKPKRRPGKGSLSQNDNDFTMMANKLNNFVAVADTSREPTQDEKFKTFYDIKPEKISYLNIPRREEVKRYRELQKGGAQIICLQAKHADVYS